MPTDRVVLHTACLTKPLEVQMIKQHADHKDAFRAQHHANCQNDIVWQCVHALSGLGFQQTLPFHLIDWLRLWHDAVAGIW